MARKRRSAEDSDIPMAGAASVGGLAGTEEAAKRVEKNQILLALKQAMDSGLLNKEQLSHEIGLDTDKLELQNLSIDEVTKYVEDGLGRGTFSQESLLTKLGLATDEPIHVKTLANGRNVAFKKVVIKHDEIDELTEVSSLNPREQKNLSLVDVADILETLPELGLQEVAYGFYNDKGMIEVVDGSRRRFSCKYAKQDYSIYVTDEILTLDDFVALDSCTEAKLQRTPVENGTYWLRIKQEKGFTSFEELAKHLRRPLSTVKEHCSVASVDADLLALSYSPSRLGISLIKRLRKLGTKYDNEQLDKLRQVRSDYIHKNKSTFENYSHLEINRRLIKVIEQKAIELFSDGSGTDTRAKFETFIDVNKKKGSKILIKKDIKDRHTSSIQYDLRNIPATKRDEVHESICQLLRDCFEEEE